MPFSTGYQKRICSSNFRLVWGLRSQMVMVSSCSSQSPKALKEFFQSINFKPSIVDPCLFIHSDATNPCLVFVHVDALVIIGPEVSFLKQLIKKRFKMEDLGECRYVLGMRVTRDQLARTLTLSQDRYCKEILKEFNLLDCKSTLTPLTLNIYSPCQSLTTPSMQI